MDKKVNKSKSTKEKEKFDDLSVFAKLIKELHDYGDSRAKFS